MGEKLVGTLRSRRNRMKEYNLQNRKDKRITRNLASITQHSLGEDVTIVRLKKGEKVGDPKIFNDGNIAIIDADTNKLVVAFRYVDVTDVRQGDAPKYDHAISMFY